MELDLDDSDSQLLVQVLRSSESDINDFNLIKIFWPVNDRNRSSDHTWSEERKCLKSELNQIQMWVSWTKTSDLPAAQVFDQSCRCRRCDAWPQIRSALLRLIQSCIWSVLMWIQTEVKRVSTLPPLSQKQLISGELLAVVICQW